MARAVEQWELYPCQMGDHLAWIAYRHDLADAIDGRLPPTLVQIRIGLRDARDDGMPGPEDFAAFPALEDAISAHAEARGGAYVGRVTVNGARYLHLYADTTADDLRALLTRLSKATGYSLRFILREDPKYAGYHQELYPSKTDWQVVLDRRVLDSLAAHGDPLTASRLIRHWAYLPSEAAARAYATWAAAEGYAVEAVRAPQPGRDGWGVAYTHAMVPELFAIARRTVRMLVRADELGGEYDGWETSVEQGAP